MPMIALIHIKKTAGKSLKHLMRCEFGAAHCDVKRWHRDDRYFTAAGLARLQRLFPWLRSIAGHSIRAYSDLRTAEPDLAYYTFVREPVARCLSEYQYSVAQGRIATDSFERWIADPQNRDAQVKSLAGGPDLDAAMRLAREELSLVGLMEAFDESLALMPALLGTPVIRPRPRKVNAARDNSVRERLVANAHAMAAIRDANALDCELYDYAARDLFPRARRRAGTKTVDLAPARGSFNRRFWGNAACRYGVYKPVVWAWRATHPPA